MPWPSVRKVPTLSFSDFPSFFFFVPARTSLLSAAEPEVRSALPDPLESSLSLSSFLGLLGFFFGGNGRPEYTADRHKITSVISDRALGSTVSIRSNNSTRPSPYGLSSGILYFRDKIAKFDPSSKQFWRKANEYRQQPRAQTSVL